MNNVTAITSGIVFACLYTAFDARASVLEFEGNDKVRASYARAHEVSLDRARSELEMQELAGDLQAEIEQLIPEVYGGLYLDHSPALRVVVLLKNGGKGLLAPLVEGKYSPLMPMLEVRKVSWTYKELRSTLEIAAQRISDAGQKASLEVDVRSNTVIVIAEDPAALQASLKRRNTPLPASVTFSSGQTALELAPIGGGEPLGTPGSLGCTSAFGVIHIDGRRGIVTAGHCGDTTQEFEGVSLLFVSERYETDWDVQWHTTSPFRPTNTVYNGSSRTHITAYKRRRGQAIGA